MTWMSNLWQWLDGKKTLVGLIITAIGGLMTYFQLLTASYPNAKWVVIGLGVAQFLNGWLHKAYKYKYNEEHP